MTWTLAGLCAGGPALLSDGKTYSAFVKSPLTGAQPVGPKGLVADTQVDRINHGGADKALHLYPRAHLAVWEDENPDLAPLLSWPGTFGSNLDVAGVTEADLCIGDVVRVGRVLLQVAQPRMPCNKINLRFGVTHMTDRVIETGRGGIYFRVLETGMLEAPMAMVLQDRPHQDWSVLRVFQTLLSKRGRESDDETLHTLAALPFLATPWQGLAQRFLDARARQRRQAPDKSEARED